MVEYTRFLLVQGTDVTVGVFAWVQRSYYRERISVRVVSIRVM